MKVKLSDDLYTTEMEVIDNTKIVFPDIATLQEMYKISEKLHNHLERLKELNKEALENAGHIIKTHKMYSEKDREYLLYHLNKIYDTKRD